MKYLREIFVVLAVLMSATVAQDLANIIPREHIPAVEFCKEEVTLEVGDGHACITGIYYFRNNTNRDLQMPVVFPFYIDSLTAFPHHIEAAVNSADCEAVPTFDRVPDRDMVSLRIPVKADDITSWRLTYQQEIGAKRAVYILTSTAAWKKPLEEATYYFIAPDSFSDINTWPIPDTTYIEGPDRIFKSVRYDFMPQRDMEITWK